MMRKILFRMDIRELLAVWFITSILFLGCIDTGDVPGLGPKEVSIDLSTPEGVSEAWVKYKAIGEYDNAYDLYCDDEYYEQVDPDKPYPTREDFIRAMESAEKTGAVTDLSTLKVSEGDPITSSRLRKYYGIGTVADEGYKVKVEGKWRVGLGVAAISNVVKYRGRYCIAQGLQ